MSSSQSAPRVVLITGGGTGLGLACAAEFCGLGDHVCITGRRESVLNNAVAAIKQKISGAKVFCVPLDVRDNRGVESVIDEVVRVTGSLPSIVVNNAAGNFISPSERLSPNAWRSIIDIVALGGINVITSVGKRWIEQRQNRYQGPVHEPQVVFLSVGASYVQTGSPFVAPSAAAKAAIFSLNQSLAVEWGKYNIRFVMVAPGPIHTEGAMSRLDPTGAMMSSAFSDPNNREKIGQLVPLGFTATPAEYAKFVSFLASSACRWLTGCCIYYDGGAFANGGEFRDLRKVTPDQWTMLEGAIRRNATRQARGDVAAPKL